ncbi:hypothetical protein, partial [Pseudomonas viridiflava]|uniref:hypothetical protein n=1 Tax=Pseudomonas viridiflava TaxID=33069 RepID=UPI00197FE521
PVPAGQLFRDKPRRRSRRCQLPFHERATQAVPVEQVTGPAYDLRTGELFSREAYAAKLGEDAKVLVDAFFPPRG